MKKARTVAIPVTLNFECCECGCHGSSAKNYWIGQDSEKFYLAIRGHGYEGTDLGRSASFRGAIEICEKCWEEELLELAKP
jgi:hypothetical protein